MSAAHRVVSLSLAAVLCLTLTLAGCGSAPAPPAGPTVTLRLETPVDDSRGSASSSAISGTVSPARARVQVLGRSVHVSSDGSFSATVGLAPGTNLIDVEASAARSSGAVAAVRVIRYLLVTVPSLRGESPGHASAAVSALGLVVKLLGSSDPLNFLIPGPTHVCSSSPAAGNRVAPGSTVTLKTSRFCGF